MPVDAEDSNSRADENVTKKVIETPSEFID